MATGCSKIGLCQRNLPAQHPENPVRNLENQRQPDRYAIVRISRRSFRLRDCESEEKHGHRNQKSSYGPGNPNIKEICSRSDGRLDPDKSAQGPNERGSRNEIGQGRVNVATHAQDVVTKFVSGQDGQQAN